MMRAWTDIVAVGTALSIRSKLASLGRDLQDGDVEGVARGAMRHAETLHPTRYLEAVGDIHRFGGDIGFAFQPFDLALQSGCHFRPAFLHIRQVHLVQGYDLRFFR